MGSSPFFFRKGKMLNRGLDKLELLRIVEAVANEKSIDKELVIGSMEDAIQKAALTKFGSDNNIEVIIDRESGDIKIQKVLEIVEKVEDSSREITLDTAQKYDPKNKSSLLIIVHTVVGIIGSKDPPIRKALALSARPEESIFTKTPQSVAAPRAGTKRPLLMPVTNRCIGSCRSMPITLL